MTGRVIGVPNYTGKQSDNVYAKMQWFIDNYDVLKLVKENSFLPATSQATIPLLPGIYKLADTGQVWQRLVDGTLVRRQSLEITPETLASMQSVIDNISAEWNTVQKPSFQAAVADIAQTQSVMLDSVGIIAWTGGDRSTIPLAAGKYKITADNADLGTYWERKNDGSLVQISNDGLPASVRYARVRSAITPYDVPPSLQPVVNTDAKKLQWAVDTALAEGVASVLIPSKAGSNGVWKPDQQISVIGDGSQSIYIDLQARVESSYAGDLANQGVFRCLNLDILSFANGEIATSLPFPGADSNRSDYGVGLLAANSNIVKVSHLVSHGHSKDGILIENNNHVHGTNLITHNNRDGGLKLSRNRSVTVDGGESWLNGHEGDFSTGYGLVMPSVTAYGLETERTIINGYKAHHNWRKGIDAHSLAWVQVEGVECWENRLWQMSLMASVAGRRGKGIKVNGARLMRNTHTADPAITAAAALMVGAVSGAEADLIELSHLTIQDALQYGIYVYSGGLRRLTLSDIDIDGVYGNIGKGVFVTSDGNPDVETRNLSVRNALSCVQIPKARTVRMRDSTFETPATTRVWSAGTAFDTGSTIRNANGYVYRRVGEPGVTGTNEPVWPTVPLTFVKDGAGATTGWELVSKVGASALQLGSASTQVGRFQESGTEYFGPWTKRLDNVNIASQPIQKDNFNDGAAMHPEPIQLQFSANLGPGSAGSPTVVSSGNLALTASGDQVWLMSYNTVGLTATRVARVKVGGVQVGADISLSGNQRPYPIPIQTSGGGYITIEFVSTDGANGTLPAVITVSLRIQPVQARP